MRFTQQIGSYTTRNGMRARTVSSTAGFERVVALTKQPNGQFVAAHYIEPFDFYIQPNTTTKVVKMGGDTYLHIYGITVKSNGSKVNEERLIPMDMSLDNSLNFLEQRDAIEFTDGHFVKKAKTFGGKNGSGSGYGLFGLPIWMIILLLGAIFMKKK